MHSDALSDALPDEITRLELRVEAGAGVCGGWVDGRVAGSYPRSQC